MKLSEIKKGDWLTWKSDYENFRQGNVLRVESDSIVYFDADMFDGMGCEMNAPLSNCTIRINNQKLIVEEVA